MNWSDVSNVVENLAPTIASVIGGPLAGSGVSALEKLFGLTPEPTASTDQRLQAVATAVAGATPQQLADMRKADQDYQVAMAEAGFKDVETLQALAVQDTVSARTMQSTNKSMTPALLTLFITLGFFGMLAALLYHIVPTENANVVYTFTGTLGTAWLTCVHFWFGGSSSSDRKTELLAQSTPGAPNSGG